MAAEAGCLLAIEVAGWLELEHLSPGWAAITGTFAGNEAHLQISICRGLLDSLARVD